MVFMTLRKAMFIFRKKLFSDKVYGYWIQGDNIVLNTFNPDTPHDPEHMVPRIYQFIVTPDGNVIPTTPADGRLANAPYIKL